jgi:predicted transposase YdaD
MSTGTYEFTSDFALRLKAEGREAGRAEGREAGRAEGEAAALLEVLAARGIAVPEGVRERITECTDVDQLRTWVRRSVTIESIEGLFE